MNSQKTWALAEDFENHLGNPWNNNNPCSFNQILADDEVEFFPQTLYSACDAWGLNRFYVPREWGGEFDSFEELLRLIKVIARRDLTAAIAHSAVYLGSVGIWLHGSDQQKQTVAQLVLNHQSISFGLTEENHGSDILANELSAYPAGDKYIISGKKWLINNANRCAAMVVFARTTPAGGPRGFSQFLVVKKDVEKLGIDKPYRALPRLKTHGIRGADISGIEFFDCPVNSSSLIGTLGSGLETTLKTLQITRTLCSALSLGAANTAFFTTLDFSKSRQLYGNSVFSIPTVQNTLVCCFIDILICDCMAVAAVRGLHVSTEQFSVWSAVVKYFVPVTIEKNIQKLSSIVGARSYLREGPQAILQKIIRDNSLIGLFDGNTSVNLHAIASQLKFLKFPIDNKTESTTTQNERILQIFDTKFDLPAFDGEKLSLFNHGQDDVMAGLLNYYHHLQIQNLETQPLDGWNVLTSLVNELLNRFKLIIDESKKLTASRGSTLNNSSKLHHLAQQYCLCHAASTFLQMWDYSRFHLNVFFTEIDWPIFVLQKILNSHEWHPSETIKNKLIQKFSDTTQEQFSISLFSESTVH
jgi:alkylation response protein AidB-like acyl-CoA dehydrogenase